ncbi:hypothetical protein H6F77_00425 [Microcoleus sp. FACHB-831]|jgi:hypothetical protein|nr:hypothetical protein [Microcoleus sp. FACHB-831]MBD1919588.1 hypothetical protein [Microcoleus sp. FACHB-831]
MLEEFGGEQLAKIQAQMIWSAIALASRFSRLHIPPPDKVDKSLKRTIL